MTKYFMGWLRGTKLILAVTAVVLLSALTGSGPAHGGGTATIVEAAPLPPADPGPTTAQPVAGLLANCISPDSGDWVITQDCILNQTDAAPGGVIVDNNATLTIPTGVTLGIDLQSYTLRITNGARVLVNSGGKIDTYHCPDYDAALLAEPYAFRYGLSGSELQSQFYDDSGLQGQGYRPVRLTGYVDGTAVRFATKWVQTGGPEWRSRFGLTGAEFHQRYLDMRDDFRLVDVSGYNTPDGLRYADIWVRNDDNQDWAVYRDSTVAEVEQLKSDLRPQGWVPTRVEAYVIGGESRYISLWIKAQCKWHLETKLTRAAYQALFDEYQDQFRLAHLDSHTQGGDIYFSAIWWQQPQPGIASTTRSDRDWYLFQRFLNNNWCSGFGIDNFYATDIPGGVRYGGIWAFNAPLNITAASPFDLRVTKHVNCAPARGGAAIINLTTGEQTLVHPDQVSGASSTIKIPLLFSLLRRIDADPNVTLNTTIPVGGPYGNDQNNRITPVANTNQTLRFLAQVMIADSNNWATNRLIDYVTMAQVNQEMSDLGLSQTRLRRYMTGNGPTPNAGTDYANGIDGTSTPREMTTLLQLINANNNLLSTNSFNFFWNTLTLDPDDMTALLGGGAGDGVNTKGWFPTFLIPNITPNTTGLANLLTLFNKFGNNTWGTAATPVGTYAHKPQIATHRQASDAGRLVFQNGNVVFYAVFMDEADNPPPATTERASIGCVGLETVSEYAGVVPASVPTQCQ